jgi:hypothetical protein
MMVAHFQAELTRLFNRARSTGDLNDYRLSRGRWKKLADEILPISRFLRFRGMMVGRIRFPLNNNPPDCWLWPDDGSDRIGIEVTIAQGTERFHLATELVEKGQGRGFIGLPDDAPRIAFERAMSTDRVMYTPDQALSAVRRGILRCLTRKNKVRFANFVLVIQAHLLSLPGDRWEAIRGHLSAAAAVLPFSKIYVIGDANERPSGFQIK